MMPINCMKIKNNKIHINLLKVNVNNLKEIVLVQDSMIKDGQSHFLTTNKEE